MEVCTLFSSRSLTEHILRGILAFGAIALAVRYEALVWPLFVFLPAAFLLWRGCPACWALGLYETVKNKFDRPPQDRPSGDWMSQACAALRQKYGK